MKYRLHNLRAYTLNEMNARYLVVSGTTAALIGVMALSSAATIATTQYNANQQRIDQKKILDDQNNKATAYESKMAGADAAAKAAADAKIIAKKRAVTQTILTSPLGAADDAGTGAKPTLLGGI